MFGVGESTPVLVLHNSVPAASISCSCWCWKLLRSTTECCWAAECWITLLLATLSTWCSYHSFSPPPPQIKYQRWKYLALAHPQPSEKCCVRFGLTKWYFQRFVLVDCFPPAEPEVFWEDTMFPFQNSHSGDKMHKLKSSQKNICREFITLTQTGELEGDQSQV